MPRPFVMPGTVTWPRMISLFVYATAGAPLGGVVVHFSGGPADAGAANALGASLRMKSA